MLNSSDLLESSPDTISEKLLNFIIQHYQVRSPDDVLLVLSELRAQKLAAQSEAEFLQKIENRDNAAEQDIRKLLEKRVENSKNQDLPVINLVPQAAVGIIKDEFEAPKHENLAHTFINRLHQHHSVLHGLLKLLNIVDVAGLKTALQAGHEAYLATPPHLASPLQKQQTLLFKTVQEIIPTQVHHFISGFQKEATPTATLIPESLMTPKAPSTIKQSIEDTSSLIEQKPKLSLNTDLIFSHLLEIMLSPHPIQRSPAPPEGIFHIASPLQQTMRQLESLLKLAHQNDFSMGHRY